MSIFGSILTTTDVEKAVIGTLKVWIDTYISETEGQHFIARGTIARPVSYNATYDYDNWPEGQLPGIAVVCPGATELEYRATGINGVFKVQVDAIIPGTSEADARAVAAIYCSAVAKALMDNGDLASGTTTPFASATRVQGFTLDLPDVDNRTLAVGSVEFMVFVDSIMALNSGPGTPDPPSSPQYPGAPDVPWAPFPVIESTDLTFTGEPVNE